MSTTYFLQRFEAGRVLGLPYAEVLDFLSGFGALARGQGDLELSFANADIADVATVVGDEVGGVTCIGLERPFHSDATRDFLMAALQRFDVCVFADALSFAWLRQDSSCEPPQALLDACLHGPTRVVRREQMLPSALSQPIANSGRPALRYDNPNPAAPKRQWVDWVDDAQGAHYHIDLHPAACNAGSLRVVRNIMGRLELARQGNESLGIALHLHFAHGETWQQVMEAPAVGAQASKAMTYAPPPGDDQGPRRACADRDVFMTAAQSGARCVELAERHWGIALDVEVGVGPLDTLLQKLQAQLVDSAGARQLNAESLERWCVLAGAHLGNCVVRAVGGQWSVVVFDGARHPVVLTYTGRIVFPMLRVLDRLCLGPVCAVDAWFAELLANARARSVDDFDLVSLVPALCMELMRASNPNLPLHDQLQVARLDFSLASLMELDRWLLQVRAQRDAIDPQHLSNVVKAAGSFLGEVIRSRDVYAWRWENYADYFDGSPGLPQVSKVLGSAAVMRGHGQLLFPLGQIGSRLRDDDAPSLPAWAGGVVNQAGGGHEATVPNAEVKPVAVSPASPALPQRSGTLASTGTRSTGSRFPKVVIVPVWTAVGALSGVAYSAAFDVPWTGATQLSGMIGLGIGIALRAHAGRPSAP